MSEVTGLGIGIARRQVYAQMIDRQLSRLLQDFAEAGKASDLGARLDALTIAVCRLLDDRDTLLS